MNREQRILNHNKRDATRIVSRKPSDSEGNNGDFAVGNTAQGPMLFSKSNNRWYSLKPKKVLARQNVTFKGNVQARGFRVIRTDTDILSENSSWVNLGSSTTTSANGVEASDNDLFFVRNTSLVSRWHDQTRIPILLPKNVKIKKLIGRHTVSSDLGESFEVNNFTIRIFCLEDGKGDWDPDSSSDYITWNGNPDSLKDSATVTYLEQYKTYEFNINNDIIYPKGSLLAIHVEAKKEDGSDADFVRSFFQLHLGYDE